MNTAVQTVVIREAQAHDLIWALMLVVRQYTKAGILKKGLDLDEYYQRLFTKFCASGPKTTLVAELDGKIVGTITYQIGGTFPIENEFKEELARLRTYNVPLVYVGSFAVEEGQDPSLVGLLTDTVQERVDATGETIAVIVVNNHHMRYHMRKYGFKLCCTKPASLEDFSETAKSNYLVRDNRTFKEEQLAA